VHEREVELAFSGQSVAAERHGDLLHRDFKSGGRERLDEDVGRRAGGLQRGGSLHGADGDGYSIYLTDPEGTVVELKSGN
jgi:hypothetical protein